jgi:hypothetical protein
VFSRENAKTYTFYIDKATKSYVKPKRVIVEGKPEKDPLAYHWARAVATNFHLP